MLEEQMKRSAEFSSQNFGLQCGSDFPEVARDLLANEHVAIVIFTNTVRLMLSTKTVAESMKKASMGTPSPTEMVKGEPLFYQASVEFFYWGLQVGRELEKQQTEALATLKENNT
jgi:hypothetical protein